MPGPRSVDSSQSFNSSIFLDTLDSSSVPAPISWKYFPFFRLTVCRFSFGTTFTNELTGTVPCLVTTFKSLMPVIVLSESGNLALISTSSFASSGLYSPTLNPDVSIWTKAPTSLTLTPNCAAFCLSTSTLHSTEGYALDEKILFRSVILLRI